MRLEEQEGLEYTILLDQGEYINQATGSVVSNLLMGAGLAVIILFFFYIRNINCNFR